VPATSPSSTSSRTSTKGTPIAHRADFNTLDNPFAFSSDPEQDGIKVGAAAGLHFVVFNPSSDDFRRNRLDMDGKLTDAADLRSRRARRTWASTA